MCVQQCRSQLIVVLRCVQSNRIFSSMVEDLLMDIVLQSHQEIARAKSVCEICHTRYAIARPDPAELCLTRIASLRCNAGESSTL